MKYLALPLFVASALLLPPAADAATTTTTVTYRHDGSYDPDLINPERGLYWQRSYRASSPSTLDPSHLKIQRETKGMTVVLRLYYLDTSLDFDELPSHVLRDIATDFDAMREGGVKAVIRFAYSDSSSNAVHDPPKERILSHIDQLSSALSGGEDVILAVQAGFLGPWGEWHSSTNLLDDDHEGRREVLEAILDAVPSSRTVQVRTPQSKIGMFSTYEYPPPVGGWVMDGGFEGGGDIGSIWTSYGVDGYSPSALANSGSKSVMVVNGGAKQSVSLVDADAGPGSTIRISGYSMAVDTSEDLGSDYSIYADLTYDDGSNEWGVTAQFPGGTHDWTYQEGTFVVPDGKTVVSASLYALYRNDDVAGGTAFFDDVNLEIIGPAVQTGGLALDESTARSGSHESRVGHHNDCFLASDTDYGTYHDKDVEYPYLSAETKYTSMGGETCAVNPPRSECDVATTEMELFHYTYLNSGYNQDVLDSWSTCMDEVKSRLGYNLVLESGSYPSDAVPGGDVPFSIVMDNVGYAAPVNERRVQLVLRDSDSDELCAATLSDVDARGWYGGESHVLSGTARLPSTMPPGSYQILLHVTDVSESLRTDLNFKTKVGNVDGTVAYNEAETGLIDLKHVVQVASDGSATPSSPEPADIQVVCGVDDDILPALPDPNLVSNGGFEGTSVETDWSQYGEQGYVTTSAEFYTSEQSVEVVDGGAKQSLQVSIPARSTVLLSGYSKSVGASTNLWSNYAVYADVTYDDDTHEWGVSAKFPGGTTTATTGTADGWVYREAMYVPTKDVKKISLYALYRNDPNPGVAYFDDVKVLAYPNLVQDSGFEEASSASRWASYGASGYAPTASQMNSGAQGIEVTDGGARQIVQTPRAVAGSAVTIGGYSKSVGASTDLWSDYSIYADLTYVDGTNEWGVSAKFPGGTSDGWEYRETTFVVPKDLESINLYAMYRNDENEGVAYFDDLRVVVVPPP